MPARVPMTERERAALLALPTDEGTVVRVHTLDTGELAGVVTARTPGTRLGFALQLCCLRYPGRYLRRGEVIPAAMLEHSDSSSSWRRKRGSSHMMQERRILHTT
nr:DUF4158 domain-containing protein [Sphingomonas lenta]